MSPAFRVDHALRGLCVDCLRDAKPRRSRCARCLRGNSRGVANRRAKRRAMQGVLAELAACVAAFRRVDSSLRE